MQDIVQRFWGFEKLIGPILVKIVYYIGLAGLAVAVTVGVLTGLMQIVTGHFLGGLLAFVLSPVIGAVALVYWRFLCEIFILAFETYARLGEIRDRLPAAPTPHDGVQF
ncbi:MAG: DUF4282 domain-containing protein [Caulobacterales bacterium]